jgi:ribosome-binding protein aMBF1 (putative translation factor)
MSKKKQITDARGILDRRHPPTKKDAELRAKFRGDLEIAEMIYEARMNAGLSQRALAKLVGTTASVICQLEDANYEGHSMAMLRRVAQALHQRVEVRFVPEKNKSDLMPA